MKNSSARKIQQKKEKKTPTPRISWVWWQISLIPLIVLPLVTLLFYFPSLHYDFQFDDLANITKFYNIRHATFQQLFFSGTRWISYWINTIHYGLGKFDPFTYRLANVISHTITGVLVYYFLLLGFSRLRNQLFFSTNAFAIACTTALLFLLHPVQTQTVSYVIQGQLEGMATLSILLMSVCLLLLDYLEKISSKVIVTGILFFTAFLSCGTKEITIVAPFLLLLVDWFFVAQADVKSLKKRWWLYAGLLVLYFGIYMYFLKPTFFANLIGMKLEARNNIGNVLTEHATDKILPMHFFISQFKVILHYLTMFVWPFTISVEYDWKLVKGFFALDCFLPFLVLCGLIGFLIRQLIKNNTSVVAFAFLWFFVSIAPRSSFIPSSELLTDYKTYLSSMSVLLLLAIGFIKLLNVFSDREFIPMIMRTYRKEIHIAMSILVTLPVGFFLYQRNKVWRSGEEFWYNIIQNAPGKARAYNNYAVALSEKGQYEKAIPFYQQAIDMDAVYPDPLNNIAVAYSFLGNLDKAIESLQRSINIQPHYPEAYNNLASFLITKGDLDKAEMSLNLALQLRPYYGKAYFNLGKIQMTRGNQEKAFEFFKKACLNADLDTVDGFKIYARMALTLQKFEDAIIGCKKLVEVEKKFENYVLLATAYQGAHKFQEAKELYLALSKTHAHEFGIWYNLGEICLNLQNPREALTYFTKAQTLNGGQPQVPFKIAYCYLQLNEREKTAQVLNDILNDVKFNEQIKGLARHELSQLQKPA